MKKQDQQAIAGNAATAKSKDELRKPKTDEAEERATGKGNRSESVKAELKNRSGDHEK